MEQKYSQAAWGAKMEDEVGDFKERWQRVLDMKHCVRKLKDIRLLAANYKLSVFSDFLHEEEARNVASSGGRHSFQAFSSLGWQGRSLSGKTDVHCSNGRGTQPGHYGEESRKKNELLQYPPNVHKQKV
jgi:hypothetical protein